ISNDPRVQTAAPVQMPPFRHNRTTRPPFGVAMLAARGPARSRGRGTMKSGTTIRAAVLVAGVAVMFGCGQPGQDQVANDETKGKVADAPVVADAVPAEPAVAAESVPTESATPPAAPVVGAQLAQAPAPLPSPSEGD